MKLIVLITFTVAVTQVVGYDLNHDGSHTDIWEAYKANFNKEYDPKTELIRKKIFEQNCEHVKKHNDEYNLGKHGYTLAINEFSDLTSDEFAKTYLSNEVVNIEKSDNEHTFALKSDGTPKSIDWRGTSLVNPIENQGPCNCSYAFSSVAALEGQYAKIKKYSTSLSKQQIVDCSDSYGNNGCSGGSMSKSYAYLSDHGSMLDEDYRYTGHSANCSFDKTKVETKVKGFVYVASGRENDLADAVANIGPISAAIDASLPSFKSYSNGIYFDSSCSSTSLNHGVLVVGYGFEDTKFFWIIKNSWGSKWGNGGYAKIAKDVNNQCGIASLASVPIL